MSIEGDKFRQIHRSLGGLSFADIADLLDTIAGAKHAKADAEKIIAAAEKRRIESEATAKAVVDEADKIAAEVKAEVKAAKDEAVALRAAAMEESKNILKAANADAVAVRAKAKEAMDAAAAKAAELEKGATDSLVKIGQEIKAAEAKLAAIKEAIKKSVE